MSAKLSGKVAIVTGASKGIGASIAVHLAQAGAKVVVNYSSSREGADRVVGEITAAGGKAVAVQANLAKEADIRRLFADTKKAFGQVDILVNNAGVYDFKPLGEVTAEHFHKQFDVNVLGLILASQEAAKQFGANGGNIINVSSVVATTPVPGGVVYSATKAAVDQITRTLAAELGIQKIRVNSVNPGLVDTEGVQAVGFNEGDFKEDFERRAPLGRIGRPADIAPAVVYLASDDSSWVTGQSLHISGGFR